MATRQRDSSPRKEEPAREKRFRLFGGLRDRLNKSTPAKVTRAIVAVMHNPPAGSEERVREAAAMFSQLESAGQDEVLGKVETLLENSAPNCGQSELVTNQVYALAYFISLAAKSMESFEDMETIHECLLMAATSHQAEYTSDIFREMRAMAVVALYESGERTGKCWEELLMNSGVRAAAVNALLEMGASGEAGWAALQEKLAIVRDSIVSSPSEKRDAFLLSLIKGSDAKATCTALEMAAQLKERTPFYKAAEQLSMSDVPPDEVWTAAREFIHISDMLSEIEARGERQVYAVGELTGLVMAGLEFLRPVMETHFKDMEVLAAGGNPREMIRAIISMGMLSSARIGRPVTDMEVQAVINSLLQRWDDESISALKAEAHSITMPIAISDSPNRGKLVSLLLSDNEPRCVRAGFNISVNFEDTAEASQRAREILEGEDGALKQHAAEFLDTIALIDDLQMADERQFKAAHALIGMYLSNLSLIGIMLLIRGEMEDMIIEAAQEAEGGNVDVGKPAEVLHRLMSIGILPQRINLQYQIAE